MLQLIVLRHAKAAREPGVADHDRALTDRGRRNARAMGVWLAEQALAPDLVLVSDAKRTRQTFQLARAAFPERLHVVTDPDLYHATEATLLTAMRNVSAGHARALLCGHNPGVHDFTTGLVGHGDRAALARFRDGFPTAAVAVLGFDFAEWREIRWRSATLQHFVTPASVANDGGEGD